MRRILLVICGLCVAATGVLVALALTHGVGPTDPANAPRRSVPRTKHRLAEFVPVGSADVALPKGTIVLNVTDAKGVEPPFVLCEDVTAAEGLALVLPAAKSSPDKKGRARLSLSVPRPGRYRAWVRARWRDGCSNSISLQVGTSPRLGVGNDDVYDAWHWVQAGEYKLAAGAHPVLVLEREDGVAVDQILFSPDPAFSPAGPVLAGKMGPGVRRFGDNFARSPGHGLGAWDILSGKWQIEFSFDPNRIPNQYSLAGEAAGREALALITGLPWRGVRLAFSVLATGESKFGAVLDSSTDGKRRLRVAIDIGSKGARLVAAADGRQLAAGLGDRVRLNQWHRIVVERWAWVLRVFVDGHRVLDASDLVPRAGRLGLFVARGAAVFDDVDAEEIPWAADDGRDLRIRWVAGKGAKWYRPAGSDRAVALVGRSGTITSPATGLPVRDVLLDGNRQAVVASRRPSGAVSIAAADGETRIRRVAIAYGETRPATFRIGPYGFTEPRIEDPSDYLDFTPEEWAKIQKSPDVDKLRRRPKYVPLVGRGAHCVWSRESGTWRIKGGVLLGRGPDAALRYTQEIVSDLELLAKVSFLRAGATAEVVLYGNGAGGPRVCIGGKAPATAEPNALHLPAPNDTEWRTLRIRVSGDSLQAQLGQGAARRMKITRGDGGRVVLRVGAGAVQFDDLEFVIPRSSADGVYCAFDRRETGWWREGGRWLDHGGMSCVLSSHWVSLVAPAGEGTLWHKRSFGPDVQVAFNVEENSEWFGWTQRPSHVHHPYDNIRVVLAPAVDHGLGYRLEVNARSRTRTVLYRNGKEVASVAQDGNFPIQYCGGHAPYSPRKNRITLVKRGGVLRAVINGTEVLRFIDPDPVPVAHVGLGGYKTHINFSHIEIRKL